MDGAGACADAEELATGAEAVELPAEEDEASFLVGGRTSCPAGDPV